MNKTYRLRKNKDFQYTYKKGRSIGHSLLVLIYKRTNRPNSRIGFSISKKFGKAVKRNRIKRQLRSILQNNLANIKDNYDIIFVVRKEARDVTFSRLDEAVHNLLKRARLFKDTEGNK